MACGNRSGVAHRALSWPYVVAGTEASDEAGLIALILTDRVGGLGTIGTHIDCPVIYQPMSGGDGLEPALTRFHYNTEQVQRDNTFTHPTPKPALDLFPQIADKKKPLVRVAFLNAWSGKRDSNSRPRPWQGRALPTELFPQMASPRGLEPLLPP